MPPWDVVVAGGGPAGAVAAHMLARQGARVLLVDAVAPDAHKIGEALPGVALRLLRECDLPVPGTGGPHTPIRGTMSAWGSDVLGAADAFRDRDGPGWRLDRGRFDASLRDAAMVAGAVSCRGWVTAAERVDGLWRVQLDRGAAVTAGWLIDATGRRAALARRLGARRVRDARLVALYGLGRPDGRPALHRTVLEAAPYGWWYAAWLPSGAPVAGLHVAPSDAVGLMGGGLGWREALARTGHVGALLPVDRLDQALRPVEAGGARLDRFFGNGWIACGDAAQAFDPVSGQGIYAALYSGMMAARAVAATLDGDARAMGDYAARMERVRCAYLAQWSQAYRNEQRWPDAPFWAARHGGQDR